MAVRKISHYAKLSLSKFRNVDSNEVPDILNAYCFSGMFSKPKRLSITMVFLCFSKLETSTLIGPLFYFQPYFSTGGKSFSYVPVF